MLEDCWCWLVFTSGCCRLPVSPNCCPCWGLVSQLYLWVRRNLLKVVISLAHGLAWLATAFDVRQIEGLVVQALVLVEWRQGAVLLHLDLG